MLKSRAKLLLHSLHVDIAGEARQLLVRFTFFIKRHLQNGLKVVMPQEMGESSYSAITSHLIMLDALGCPDQRRVLDLRLHIFFDYLAPFFYQTFHSGTGFTSRLLAQSFKDLL